MSTDMSIRACITNILGSLARYFHKMYLQADIAGWEDDLERLEAKTARNLDHERIVAGELAAARATLHNITTPATAKGI